MNSEILDNKVIVTGGNFFLWEGGGGGEGGGEWNLGSSLTYMIYETLICKYIQSTTFQFVSLIATATQTNPHVPSPTILSNDVTSVYVEYTVILYKLSACFAHVIGKQAKRAKHCQG